MQTRKLLDWWQSSPPLSRFLLIALIAPLLVLNTLAFSAIFDYFHSLIVILVAASLLAFLLNYPVSWLEHQGTKREQAAILVFLLALSVLVALGITLVPIALTQAQQLVTRLPEWIDSGRRQLMMLNQQAEVSGLPINLDALLVQINDRLKGQLQSIAGKALSVAVITVTSLVDVLLTIIVTFYLLQNGDRIWHSLVDWLPARIRQPFSQTLSLSFQNFFIGQLILATCMASFLIPAFVLLKVPFGQLFGLTIGVMALVPFGGTAGIITVTLLVALQNFWLGLQVLSAAVIVQQILENFVAPRVLGSFTGLEPFWVLISILAGARVGGLLGVIVAVPIAVVIKAGLLAVRSRNLTSGESAEGKSASSADRTSVSSVVTLPSPVTTPEARVEEVPISSSGA